MIGRISAMDLDGCSDVQKLEICTRALLEACQVTVPAIRHLSENADRFEILLEVAAKILTEEDRGRWERLLLESINERRTGERKGELGKPDASKGMFEGLLRQLSKGDECTSTLLLTKGLSSVSPVGERAESEP